MNAEDTHQEILARILNRYVPLTQKTVAIVWEFGSLEDVPRNKLVFHEKRFNAFEYFQLNGISHRFNIDNEQKIITTGIYQDEGVVTPHFARTINGQSIFSLQALTECIFFKIPAGTFRELMNQNESIQSFGRKVVEQEFIQNLRYEVLFRSFTAKERLMYFRENFSQLENLIPHTIIASFLGITPVSFSRLRNELTRK